MKNNFLLLFIVFLIILTHFLILIDMRWQLPDSQIQKNQLIQGVIDSVPEKKFHGLQFVFKTQVINNDKVTTKILLSWYSRPAILHIGQHWQLQVKLKPPIGSQNPGGFDYAQFLTSHGITATGYVVGYAQNILLGDSVFSVLQLFREHIQTTISHSIHSQTLAAFISALCVGLRAGLTEANWQVLQKTGTNHLVAIAGLHIGFVAALFYFLINKCYRLFPKLLLLMPAQRVAEIAALLSAIGYSALSGFAIPAQRASIMLFFLLIGNIFYKKISIVRRLFFAASMILVLNPYAVIDSSFWLSFLSLFFLSLIITGRLQSENHIKSWIKMQGAILVGLLPVMLLFFQQISLVAFFANAIAIPWVGFIILPTVIVAMILYLFHFFLLSQKIFWLSGKLLLPLWQFLTYLSQLSFASWYHAISNPWVLVSGLIGATYCLAPKKLPAKWLGCCGLLPVFFFHVAHPKEGDFWATVIDVGQGLSVLVQTKNHVLLYDTGAHFPGGFDFGESVVAPYLRYRDIHTINRLEISHGDNDHSGGADAIVKDFTVNAIFTSAPKLVNHFHAQYCAQGQSWIWDHVYFKTLSPVSNSPYADNNSSCVIQISAHGGTLLLTGDIEKLTEYELVNEYGAQLHSMILLSPHHGSRTSSSDLFLKAVSPHYAIISAGKFNRYHLPAKSTLLRYQQNHIKVYNTADSGAVMVYVEKLSVISYQ